MATTTKKRFSLLTQCLAALAVVLVYSIGLVGSSLFVSAATATSAEARGRGGGGRGRGRGWGRGRGRGWGRGVYIAPPVVRGCYWSRRYGRTICPY
jgi:hypothetical protein